MVKFAAPLHEFSAVTADLETLEPLERSIVEAAVEKAGRTEMVGIGDVVFAAGAGC